MFFSKVNVHQGQHQEILKIFLFQWCYHSAAMESILKENHLDLKSLWNNIYFVFSTLRVGYLQETNH